MIDFPFDLVLDEPKLEMFGLIKLAGDFTFLNLWHGPKALMPEGAAIGELLLFDSYSVLMHNEEDEAQMSIEYVTSARIVAPCGAAGEQFGPDAKCTRARGHDAFHRCVKDHRVIAWKP